MGLAKVALQRLSPSSSGLAVGRAEGDTSESLVPAPYSKPPPDLGRSSTRCPERAADRKTLALRTSSSVYLRTYSGFIVFEGVFRGRLAATPLLLCPIPSPLAFVPGFAVLRGTSRGFIMCLLVLLPPVPLSMAFVLSDGCRRLTEFFKNTILATHFGNGDFEIIISIQFVYHLL